MATYTFQNPLAQLFIGKLLDALSAKPMTRVEVESSLFTSKTKAIAYLRFLHRGAEKRIHICGYEERENGGRNPRYALGNKEDAIPPGARTNAERYARRKADPEKHRRHRAKLRAAHAAKRTRLVPVTWFGALPGAQSIVQHKEAA